MLVSFPRPTTASCEKLADEPRRLEGFAAMAVATGAISALTPDGERSRLVEGDALTLAPGARCELRALTTPCEVIILEADPSWTEAMLHLSSGAPANRAVASAIVSRAANPRARRARQALRELLAPAPSALARTRAVVELLALTMEAPEASHPAPPSQAGAASRNAFLGAVDALASADALEDVTLGSFASSLGLSERQVSRLFRVELDTSFCAFMTRLRVDRARRLLEGSTLPVIQVAAETGWSSLAHFNAVFRRHTGRTPTTYRTLAR